MNSSTEAGFAVSLELHQGIATLTLCDERRMNPLDEACVAGIEQALAGLRDLPQLRALLITGRGRGFSVGADLAGFARHLEATDPGPVLSHEVGELMRRMNRVLLELRALPVPVVCAINGAAAGGGAGLALVGDVVLAARSSYFYLPFLPALGLVPDMGLSWLLPRLLGSARTIGLALLGERLSAEKAAEWGLIWDCVDDEELPARARSVAERLAALPTHAIIEARAVLEASTHNNLSEQMEYERQRQQFLIRDPAFAEGVRAFLERRSPRFQSS